MRNRYLVSILVIALLISGCSMSNQGSVSQNVEVSVSDGEITEEVVSSVSQDGDQMPPAKMYTVSDDVTVKLSKYDQLTYFDEKTATIISCQDGQVSINGAGALIDNNTITLVEEGTYIIRGTFANNSFRVSGDSSYKFHIVLDNADITCNYSAPIYAAYGDKLIITLAEGSSNYLKDTINHMNDAGNGTIYSQIDTAINGAGHLEINADYSNGIAVKKDLKIYGTNISVSANNNGIKGNNSVVLIDDNIVVTAKGDGIKTTEDVDVTKGYVLISGGLVEITSDDDVIQATRSCVITDNADVRGRCYGSLINCRDGYIEGLDSIKVWE